MFFWFSKIFWLFLTPVTLIFILFMTSGVLTVMGKKIARSFFALGIIVFVIFGMFPTGTNLLVMLENRYETKENEMPDWINGVLVLGGTFQQGVMEARGQPALNETAERILAAIKMADKYPNAMIGYSGGNGTLFNRDEGAEAEDFKMFLEWYGMTMENVLYEDESRNTYENIKFSRNLFLPIPEEKWVLITSAYHMPRAMAVVKTLRWPGEIIPYAVDYRTAGKISWLPSLDIADNLRDSSIALHEYIGYLAYTMTGKISFTG